MKNMLICKSVTSFVYSFVFICIFASYSVWQLDIYSVKLSFYAPEYIYYNCCTCRHFRCNTSIFRNVSYKAFYFHYYDPRKDHSGSIFVYKISATKEKHKKKCISTMGSILQLHKILM